MLLRRKHGQIAFERSASAPTYSFKPDEFSKVERYIWYVQPDTRKSLDADRLQMGNLSVAAWVVFILNQWIGKPDGLRT
jgi:hypothetical protein